MTMSALANCEFPDKTPNEPDRWNWIHCQVRLSKKRNPTELIMPDLSGEAILEEVDHPHTYPVIRAFLTKCAGVLILVDAVRLMEGEKDQDFFAMKMLTYLCELDDDPKKGWPSRPISIIFTKADRCETCFDDASEFARKHAPGLWQHCNQRFARTCFFAAGVAGAAPFRWSWVGRARCRCGSSRAALSIPFAGWSNRSASERCTRQSAWCAVADGG